MKKFGMIVGVIFFVTLAIVVGLRMSADAMAVVVGIVCGVLASVPTSGLLVWVMRQRERQLETQVQPRSMQNFPPVVVVNGQGTTGYGNGGMATPSLMAGGTNGPRNFKVVGQENTETNGDVLPSFWDEL